MTDLNELNKIHLGKWEDILVHIPSDFIDIVITSPPYNVNLGNNKLKKDKYDTYNDDMPYENYLKWMDRLFTECYRVLKIGGRICINIGDGANGQVTTHADFTVMMKKCFIPMTTIVWDKGQIGCSTAWGSYQSPSQPSFPTQFEFIIVMGKEVLKHEGDKTKISVGGKEFQKNSRALWRFKPETRMMELYGHPAVFPEELPRRLIQQLTYEDDIVLDPFSGSGTTCTVAKKLKRNYIGIEMGKNYYERSIKRLGETPNMKRVVNESGREVNIPEWML
jgi:DNA modification methylase